MTTPERTPNVREITAETDLEQLTEVFTRVRDEVVALHGQPVVQADEPTRMLDYLGLTAAWLLGGANHGFKIKYFAVDRMEILTWAHGGPVGAVTVHLRSPEPAGRVLRQVLPPALLTPPEGETPTPTTPETPETAPEVPDELIVLAQAAESTYARTRPLDGGGWQRVPDAQVRRLITAVLPAHEATVRAKVSEELREDADAHRRLVARKPSEHDAARLARAKTLDDAAARITRGARP